MDITVVPVTEDFAAEVGDVDLTAPTPQQVAQIKAAFWQYSVLIFPGQHLTQEQHLAFAENFGPLEISSGADVRSDPGRIRPELADTSNLVKDGQLWEEQSRRRQFQMANRIWHTDSSFRHLPALCSLLYARSIVPLGGRTEFADQRAAYDALPKPTQRRLEGLVAEHAIRNSRERLGFTDISEEDAQRLPPVPQMVVRTLPESGRKSLYLASHAGRILGMADTEGRALIDELIAHITQRQFVYSHRWRLHDLVMWDNRCTLHRATVFDDLHHMRDVQRATVSDVANTCEQAGVRVA